MDDFELSNKNNEDKNKPEDEINTSNINSDETDLKSEAKIETALNEEAPLSVSNKEEISSEAEYPQNIITSVLYEAENPKSKDKKHGILLQMVAISLASSILGGAVVGSYFKYSTPGTKSAPASYSSSQQTGMLSNVSAQNTDTVVSAIAEKVGPSVVGIKTTAVTRGFFGAQQAGGEGSGIIYSADGYIVTNFHVIQDAVDTSGKKIASGAKVEVVLPNHTDKSYEAQLVGYDSKTDLAVIKIQASNLPAAALGNSDNLKVGEIAVAIGNPGGLEYMGSVTTGIISGLNRTIATETGKQLKLIQTDAAINPGNSGGALVNSAGQVIGINSVKIVSTGFEGIGFAIPSNTVKEIADSLINYKYVKGRTYLGISVDQRFNDQIAQQYNVPAGVLVQDVSPMSGAYKAGIKAGDIITKFDGQAVKSYDDLDGIKSKHKPGDVVSAEIYRDGKTLTVTVTLQEDQNN